MLKNEHDTPRILAFELLATDFTNLHEKKPTHPEGWLFVPLILELYPSKSVTNCAIGGGFLKFGVNHV